MSDVEVIRTLDDERSFWRALVRVHGDILQHLDQELHAATGLPLMELEALYDLSEAPHKRLQLHQLASRLGISRSAATRLVDRLERAGFVEREVNARDKRRTHAILTAAGATTLDGVRELYAHVLHYALLRHRSLDGLVVYTMAGHPNGDGEPRPPSWYRVDFASPTRREPD